MSGLRWHDPEIEGDEVVFAELEDGDVIDLREQRLRRIACGDFIREHLTRVMLRLDPGDGWKLRVGDLRVLERQAELTAQDCKLPNARWSGERCKAERGSAVVAGKITRHWWCHYLLGTRVECVRVGLKDGRVFFVWDEVGEATRKIRDHGGRVDIGHRCLPNSSVDFVKGGSDA